MGNTCAHSRYVAEDWSGGLKNRHALQMNLGDDITNVNSLVNLQHKLNLSQSSTTMALHNGLSNKDIDIDDPEIKRIISILGI